MPSPLSSPSSAVFRTRAVAVLTGVLVAALVLVPNMLAARGRDSDLADRHKLVDELRAAFVGYWRSGERQYPPDLNRIVDYWFRYNVTKGVIAAALLIVAVALSLLLWKAFLRDSAPRKARSIALASTGALAVGLALFAVVTVTLSIQRAAAPLGALLPLLDVGTARGELADTINQVRQQLANSTGEHAQPALEVMISDYVRYHVVRAIAVVPLTLVGLGASAVLWRKRPRKGSVDRRARLVLSSFAVLSGVLSLFFIMLFVANQGTAADPEPGLLGLFNGSW